MFPRSRLFRPTFVAILPGFLIAALYLWPAHPVAARNGPAAGTEAAGALHVGAWGSFEVTTLVISPPLDMIPEDWGRGAGVGRSWYFPKMTPAMAGEFLASTGLEPDQVSTLMASAREEASIKGTVLTPSEKLLWDIPRDVRARLYLQLAGSELNVSEAQPLRYEDESVGAWLDSSPIAPATRRLVEPLIYRHGRHLCFADTELLRSRVTDRDELRRLAKTLLRQKTARLRLSVTALSEVPTIVAYWGRGGRRTDIQPLLESIAGASKDRAVDIIHLLPSFARTHLYRYPRLTVEDLNRTQLSNCLWTALNFFNDPPDDRYLDARVAVERLQRDYYLVHDNFELGDIVSLVDERGNIFHAVVYLGDNFVFTKNGFSPLAPWVILPLETAVDYYRLAVEKPRLFYHRRKDL